MSNEVFIFGDSVSKGVVFDSIQNKYKFLKDNFAKLFSQSSGMEIANYSSFGCTVTKGIKIYERHTKDLDSGNIVVLEYGGNDCDYDWAAVSDRPEQEHMCKTPIDEFKIAYKGLIDRVKEQGNRPVLMNLPPLDPIRYFAKISDGRNPQNILKWLGDEWKIYRWHEYYSDTVEHLGREMGIPVIDVRSPFLERHSYFDLMCDDGIHPNAKGHELISATISKQSKLLLA